MSIAEQITRIKTNISSAYSKAEEKGATMPTVLNTANLPATIESITGGGGAEIINQNEAGISPMYAWQGTEEEWNAGETKNWYNWKSGGELGSWTETSLPVSAYWRALTFGNNKFITINSGSNTDICAYSDDGINWTQGTMPSSQFWRSVAYGNGKFVAVTYYSDVSAYSTDGINWTQSTMPSSSSWNYVTYGNGKFVAVTENKNVCAYSTDGITWTQSTMPSYQYWNSVAYGNGKFVAVAYSTNVFAYSEDGITWTAGTMPSSRWWYSVAYGNGRFVSVVRNKDVCAYSDDGITWIESTLPTTADWNSVTYGNGKFVAVADDSTTSTYSDDGITWTQVTISSQIWNLVTYGNGKFVAVADNTSTSAYLPYASLSCYTDTTTPTTSSKVYDSPAVESTLTITDVGESDIVLSDMNVYDRNESGDTSTTQTIGEAHPDYLSFIDGVGVRIGTTDIADLGE